MKGVRLIEISRIYSGSIDLRKDKFSINGKIVDKEIIGHKNSVGIVALKDNNVILVTQYRRAVNKVLLEIPAGKIEKNETPKEAAVREMAEEIGYAGTLRPLLKWYLAPGYSTELMYVFAATNLKKIARGLLDDDENIEIRKIGLGAAIKKCLNGKIYDAKTIAALLAYYNQSNSNSSR
ncbi:MAG: NUDIX hydrolase [Thermoproteota archaeon]|jgi:ADP-ribose pyrophosphatase|nr:NUDIX hydrolase [Thermoproteota archaeon]MDQ3807788.1 NUDIX hydrolase [Thermoproteota archaeon]MDQ3882972.1 NUDIX hydrolase [Thermoproteota archaeon]MDQ5843503.1 NUDIX hydrolase [Thermoproteota archaeon]